MNNTLILNQLVLKQKFDYLDLELNSTKKRPITLDYGTHSCYFSPSFHHNLHSDSAQLNSLIDLTLSFGNNIEHNFSKIYSVLTKEKSLRTLLETIRDNTDYLKIQQDKFLKKKESSLHSLTESITRLEKGLNEFRQLTITQIELQNKQLEKINTFLSSL